MLGSLSRVSLPWGKSSLSCFLEKIPWEIGQFQISHSKKIPILNRPLKFCGRSKHETTISGLGVDCQFLPYWWRYLSLMIFFHVPASLPNLLCYQKDKQILSMLYTKACLHIHLLEWHIWKVAQRATLSFQQPLWWQTNSRLAMWHIWKWLKIWVVYLGTWFFERHYLEQTKLSMVYMDSIVLNVPKKRKEYDKTM